MDAFTAALNRAQQPSPSSFRAQGSGAWMPAFQQPLAPPTPGSGMGFGVYSPDYLETMPLSNVGLEDDTNLAPYAYYTPTDGSESVPDVEPVDNAQEPDELSPEEREEIAAEATEGKSLDLLAEEHGLSRQEVLDLLEDDGWEVETTEQPSGVVIEEITDEDGGTTTTVVDEEGNRTTLDPGQETTREGIEGIVDGVADGQSIDEIAESQGLTRDQVIAQLEAAGFELESDVTGQGPSYVNTIEITDKESGESLVHQETKPDGTTTSRRTDAEGNEISHTVHPDGSTTRVVTEPDGRETETREDADGKTTETVTYEQNGVTVEEVTDDDGETTTTLIDEDGSRTELDPGQETTREGIDEIAEAVANGKSIDEVAEDQGLTREQVMAQLRAAGYVVESETNELANGGEQYTTRIVDAEDSEKVIARYCTGRGVDDSSLYIDAEGNETRRTEHTDGSTTETVTKADGREIKTTTNADGETTREDTDNGYTLITPPDGDLTLRNNEDGDEVRIARGTEEQFLAEELLKLAPDDSKEDEVLQAVIEEMLVERDDEGNIKELEDLETDLDEKKQAVEAAINEIVGEDGDKGDVIKSGEGTREGDPLGKPPSAEASSGGDWVAMFYQGEWKWVDPAIADALEAQETASLTLNLARAEAWRRQSQLSVYALDDSFEEAMNGAGDRLDKLLAPYGLRWVPPDPKQQGLNLEDAEKNLRNANTWIGFLETEQEYQALQEEAEGLKEDAFEIYRNDEEYADYFKEEGFEEPTESVSPRNPSGEKEHTGELLHQSVVEKDGQLYLRNIYADREEPLDIPLTQSPESDPRGLSEEQQRLNRDWHDLKLGEEPAQLQNDALEAFREANPKYFNPDGYSETRHGAMGSEHKWESGELTDTRVVERDGQLYVINTYGEGYERTTKEFQLTYGPDEEAPEGRTQAERDADQAWQEFKNDRDGNDGLEERVLDEYRQRHPEHFDPQGFTWIEREGQVRHGSGFTEGEKIEHSSGELLNQQVVERNGQLYLINTYENLNEPLEVQLTFDPDTDHPGRTKLQQQINKDWASWKEYRYSSDDGLVEVAQDRHEAESAMNEWLAEQRGEAAEALDKPISTLERQYQDELEEHGEGTVVPGGEEAKRIEIDGEMRWVHPEVAAAHQKWVAAREVLQEGEDIIDRAKGLYGERHPDHVDLNGFTDTERHGEGRGAYTEYIPTGAMMEADSEIIVGDDGQLYMRNVYEDLDDPLEFRLTYAPGEAPEGRSEEQLSIDREWAEWWQAHGDGGEDPVSGAKRISKEAKGTYDDQVESYGDGTTQKLTETLPDGVDPVLVTIDDEQRSVHPDVAMALRSLEVARLQRESDATASEEMALAAEESDYRASRPSTWKLLDDGASAEHESGVQAEWQMEAAYLEANGAQGSLTQARSRLMDSQAALLTTEEGLTRAGFQASDDAMQVARTNGLSPEDQEDGLQADELSDARAELTDKRETLQESAQWNDSLQQKYSLDERLDPEKRGEIENEYHEHNPKVAEEAIADRLDELPESITLSDEDARQNLEKALGSDDEAQQDAVIDQLREIGGDDAEVRIIPILYRDGQQGARDSALFTVEDDDGKTWLVDESGSKYRNLEDYRHHNYLSDSGHVYIPENLNQLTDAANGKPVYEWQQARELSEFEQWVDPVIGIGTGIATVAAFIPLLAPIAAPIAFAGGAYFGARSASNLHEMHEHGRPLASTEGAMQVGMLATSVLPMGAGAFRYVGLTRANISRGVALRTSIGNVNTKGQAWSANPMYQEAAKLVTKRGTAFDMARRLDIASMVTGAPLLGYSGIHIMTSWNEMSRLQRTDAVMGFASGLFGMGMGYRALRATRPEEDAGTENAPVRPDLQPSGEHVADRVLGTPPEALEDVYIPPKGTEPLRGDAPEVADKSHILVRDPESGEAIIMPWIRGASDEHVSSPYIDEVAAHLAEPAIDTQRRISDRAAAAQRSLIEGQETIAAGRSSGNEMPQDHARLYHLDDIEALNQASLAGDLPAGHYVHFIRTSGQDIEGFTLKRGTVPLSGRVDDAGTIQWPVGREVKSNRDLYAVVTALSAKQVRERFRQGEELPFAEYDGRGGWHHMPESGQDTASVPQSSEKSVSADSSGAQREPTVPPWEKASYVELPGKLEFVEGKTGVSRFQDSLFSLEVRDTNRLKEQIQQAQEQGETSVFLVSPEDRQRIIENLRGAWRHILFSPDAPMPGNVGKSDYAFLQVLVSHVQKHRIVMQEPHPSWVEGSSKEASYRLYHTNEELKSGELSQQAVDHFLVRLISGAHFVTGRATGARGDFYKALASSAAGEFTRPAMGHSHYRRSVALRDGLAYPNTVQGDEAPPASSLLNALLIGHTGRHARRADTFFQLEGWPAVGLSGLKGRHAQDFSAHRQTGWNISTYGASPFSEKSGLAITLRPDPVLEAAAQSSEYQYRGLALLSSSSDRRSAVRKDWDDVGAQRYLNRRASNIDSWPDLLRRYDMDGSFHADAHAHRLGDLSARTLASFVADARGVISTGVPKDGKDLKAYAVGLGASNRSTAGYPAESFGPGSENSLTAEQGRIRLSEHKNRKVAKEELNLLRSDPDLAARIDPQLRIPTGLMGVRWLGKKSASQQIESLLSEFPFVFSGGVHVMAERGVATTMLGRRQSLATRAAGFHFGEQAHVTNLECIIRTAQDRGMFVTIESDWGPVPVGEDGRPQMGIVAYDRQFEGIMNLARDFDSADTPIVLSDLGLDVFLKPSVEPIRVELTDTHGRQWSGRVPEHIARMEQLIEAAPNVRFTVGEHSARALIESPELRRGLIRFLQRHPDAILHESGSAPAENDSMYRRTLTNQSPFINELAHVDSHLAWRFLRGNYEAMVDHGHTLMVEKTRAAITQEIEHHHSMGNLLGAKRLDNKLRHAEASLELLSKRRQVAHGEALTAFDDWLHLSRRGNASEQPGLVTDVAYPETPPPLMVSANKQQAGLGTSWGAKHRKFSTYAATLVATLAAHGVAYGVGQAVTGGAAQALQTAGSSATTMRGALSRHQVTVQRYDRLLWERMSEKGLLDDKNFASTLNRFLSVAREVGVSEQDIKQVVWHAGQMQANVAHLQRSPLSEAARNDAIIAEVRRFENAGTAALGIEPPSLNVFDARTRRGRGFSLANLLSNVVSMGAFHSGQGSLLAPERASTLMNREKGINQNALRIISGKLGSNLADRNTELRTPFRLAGAFLPAGYGSYLAAGDFVNAVTSAMAGDVGSAAWAAERLLFNTAMAGTGMHWLAGESRAILRYSRPAAGDKENRQRRLAWAFMAFGANALFIQLLNNEEQKIKAKPLTDTSQLPGYVPSSFTAPEPPPSRVANIAESPLPDVPSQSTSNVVEAQLAVLNRQGLALHAAPTGTSSVITHFPHGTFLTETGLRVSDAEGNEWVPVRGMDSVNEQQGWVMAHHVDEHAEGAMGENGRINPELEAQDYESVDVQPGQTLGGIAVRNGHDVEKVVMLNLDHIIDPSTLFPGDRVYLPEKEPR
ncbi:LysM peptidoglycan-binding domain-containing protein [Litchfieldella rifensis]|uniref:LysM peptidoglycan-binding domain-containing protein n=1 Tax=Litchfieldella rifensis TaxID=762643 RepID=A0ABV7LJ61_9GAMM